MSPVLLSTFVYLVTSEGNRSIDDSGKLKRHIAFWPLLQVPRYINVGVVSAQLVPRLFSELRDHDLKPPRNENSHSFSFTNLSQRLSPPLLYDHCANRKAALS